MTSERNPEKKENADILVKVSGDLIESDQFYDWLSSVNTQDSRLVILCGGGSAITDILNERHIGFRFTKAGREIETGEGILLAREVLERQKKILEERLQEQKIEATVFIPVMTVNGKVCHMNGDLLAEALHPNFDKIYVVTISERTKEFPDKFQKIEVVNLRID